MNKEQVKRESAVRKVVEPSMKHKIFISDDLDVLTIKQRAKALGATFNEYLTAVIMMSINEASGFKETNMNLNTFTAVSTHQVKTEFEPANNVRSLETAIIIKPTIEE